MSFTSCSLLPVPFPHLLILAHKARLTLAESGVLEVADGINAVVVVPVQEAQLNLRRGILLLQYLKGRTSGGETLRSHLVLEVVVGDVDRRFPRLLKDHKIPPTKREGNFPQ